METGRCFSGGCGETTFTPPLVFSFSIIFILLMSSLLLADGGARSGERGLDRAVWLRQQGRYEESIAILEKEVNDRNSGDDAEYRARCWFNLALNYWNQGEVSRAENAFIYVLVVAENLMDEDLKDLSRTALQLIKIYNEAKLNAQKTKYKESENLFKKGISIAESRRLIEFENKCWFQLSFTYYSQGNFEGYFECNKRVLSISEKLNNSWDIYRALINIGNYLSKKREFYKACDYFDRALVLAEQKNLLKREPVVLVNLAVVSKSLGLYELSEHYLERALEFYQGGDDLESTIWILSELALSQHRRGLLGGSINSERPVELLATALALSRQAGLKPLEARMLNNLGFVLLETDPEKARELCLKALKEGEEQNDAEVMVASMNNLGTLLFKGGEILKAREFFRRALNLALKIDYWPEIWRNYYGLGQTFEALGDYRSACQNYSQALKSLDPLREKVNFDLYRVGFDREKREVYEGLIRSLVKLWIKQPGAELEDELFDSVNRVKARVLAEELGRDSGYQQVSDNGDELERIDRMIRELLSQPENLKNKNTNEKLSELEYRYLRLQERKNGFNTNHRGEKLPGLNSVQKEFLGENQLIFDYFLGQEESYCFVTCKKSFRVVVLPPEREIERAIKLYIKLLASRETGEKDLKLAGKRIASILLPLEELENPAISSLIILPDGLLNFLPFETLIVEQPGKSEDGYLLERFSISYSPSISTLIRLKSPGRSAAYEKELLAFGHPTHSRWFRNQLLSRIYYVKGAVSSGSLSSLPFSRKEIKQLADLFPAEKTDVYLGGRASEENLKTQDLGRYRIIHFACHGLVSESYPQRSSLVLTSGKRSREDGFLSVREIYSLRMRPELVVLAACESSRGRIEKVEGAIGLPRVFMLAGSRAVISALWAVNDQASQELMTEFYRQLLAGKAKDEALRQAKLKFLSGSKSHPYYWAGYVLSGHPEKIY